MRRRPPPWSFLHPSASSGAYRLHSLPLLANREISSSMTRRMSRYTYPQARRLDLVEQLHGVKVADPYRWLEDPNSNETKVRILTLYFSDCDKAFTAAQNTLFEDYISKFPYHDAYRERSESISGRLKLTSQLD
jgi:hypothetical protein